MLIVLLYASAIVVVLALLIDLMMRKNMESRVLLRADAIEGVDSANLPRHIPFSDPLYGFIKGLFSILAGRDDLRNFIKMHERIVEEENKENSIGMMQSTMFGQPIITAWRREHVQQLLGKGAESRFTKIQGFNKDVDKCVAAPLSALHERVHCGAGLQCI